MTRFEEEELRNFQRYLEEFVRLGKKKKNGCINAFLTVCKYLVGFKSGLGIWLCFNIWRFQINKTIKLKWRLDTRFGKHLLSCWTFLIFSTLILGEMEIHLTAAWQGGKISLLIWWYMDVWCTFVRYCFWLHDISHPFVFQFYSSTFPNLPIYNMIHVISIIVMLCPGV